MKIQVAGLVLLCSDIKSDSHECLFICECELSLACVVFKTCRGVTSLRHQIAFYCLRGKRFGSFGKFLR